MLLLIIPLHQHDGTDYEYVSEHKQSQKRPVPTKESGPLVVDLRGYDTEGLDGNLRDPSRRRTLHVTRVVTWDPRRE